MQSQLDNLLKEALRNRDLDRVQDLLSRGANFDRYEQLQSYYPMHLLLAAECNNDAGVIERLVNNGMLMRETFCITEVAFILGKYECLRLLLSRGPEVNLRLLFNYLTNGDNRDDIKYLLYQKVNVNETLYHMNAACYSALHWAAKSEDVKAVRILLDRRANVNLATGTHGATPLHLARSLPMIRLLLSRGADPNLKNAKHLSPFENFVTSRENKCGVHIPEIEYVRIMELYLDHDADFVALANSAQGRMCDWEIVDDRDNCHRHIFKTLARKGKEALNKVKLVHVSVASYVSECVRELNKLSKEMILPDLSLGDFVNKSDKELRLLAKNRKVVQCFREHKDRYLASYPIYKCYMEEAIVTFSYAVLNEKRLEYASQSLMALVPGLVDNVARKISEYLPVTDLNNLILA